MIVKDPILVVDDEVEMRIAMQASLKRCGYPVELSHNAIDGLNKIKKNKYSLVITDMTMPKRSGVEFLKDIKKHDPNIPVILITAYGTIETAVESMKHGAFDYIQKPFDFDTFIFLIERALTYKAPVKPAEKVEGDTGKVSSPKPGIPSREIITQDPSMLSLLDMAKNVAHSSATVLIQSESGTGKELLARYIHEQSDRADRPFVAVNCAALPETLLESELFGHKKGAFTGAINDHRGKFEQANGGTILLDEISEMDLSLQAKLLRVLQEHVIDRVGGSDPIRIDIRVIATTNRDLMGYVEEQKFREDLYFRLNVIPLSLPPLRERRGDVKLLSEYLADKHANLSKRDVPEIKPETMKILENYHWRGNVRELENVMERAVLLCNGNSIQPANLLMSAVPHSASPAPSKPAAMASIGSLPVEEPESDDTGASVNIKVGASMWEVEKQLIFETLKETSGNRTKAADILGISIRTLRNKLNEYREAGENLEFLGE